MQSPRELIHLIRDFRRTLRGDDYFHQAQPIGVHFSDRRGYFNDFRGKFAWPGETRNGVPLLSVPKLGASLEFPIMILQYGLGAHDCWLTDPNVEAEKAVIDVTRWILRNLETEDCFDNLFPTLHHHQKFYSSNSGMAQGECLSFLHRAARTGFFGDQETEHLRELCDRLYRNMTLPIEEGGTVFTEGEREYFCETCRIDGHVVLNGWIYALFGLYDHGTLGDSPEAKERFEQGVQHLEDTIADYQLDDGWSYYDSHGAIASPYYQQLHVHLLDAISRISNSSTLKEASLAMEKGLSSPRKWIYISRKIIDRVTRKTYYSR